MLSIYIEIYIKSIKLHQIWAEIPNEDAYQAIQHREQDPRKYKCQSWLIFQCEQQQNYSQ